MKNDSLALSPEPPTGATLNVDDPRYPYLLKEIDDPPPLLFFQGDVSLLQQPQIAIVGSRNPTPMGLETAIQLASELAQLGFTITSGLALGIDAAAHRGALQVKGKTIAVLGCGLNRIYPYRHQALAEEIRLSGLLLSEFPPNTPPLAQHFPTRNRIISGLSLGTLVVEAAPRSGSLITARMAVSQNREVFAIPGSIRNPLSRGCHQLIQQGAKLVESVTDIIAELKSWADDKLPAKALHKSFSVPLDEDQQKLVECVGLEVTSINQVVSRSQMPVQKVTSMLLELEVLGVIAAIPGGYTQIEKSK